MGNSTELCGYTAEYDGYHTPKNICCCREVWRDGRCIWHADEEDKPVGELKKKRIGDSERLDGAILRDTNLQGSISFRGCNLVEADLTQADLRNIDLTHTELLDADLAHADLRGADLNYADLLGTNFTLALLINTDLKYADLQEANLPDASLKRADLAHAKLSHADLTKANLHSTNLTDADLRWATLQNTTLEQANLTRANLFEADLTGAELYGAVLADIQFDKETEFGNHYADKLIPESIPEDDSELSPWDKARWTNRQFERLARENALPEKARNAFESRKDLRRREHWHRAPIPDRARTVAEKTKRIFNFPRQWLCGPFADHPLGHLWTWGRTAGSGLLMRYGESPGRVVTISMGIIFACAFLYPIPGIQRGPGHSPLTYADVFASDLPNALGVLGTHLYFSTVTFTTLGYGDFQPVGWARLLATVESFVGALLMALLVFVLGRRATW